MEAAIAYDPRVLSGKVKTVLRKRAARTRQFRITILSGHNLVSDAIIRRVTGIPGYYRIEMEIADEVHDLSAELYKINGRFQASGHHFGHNRLVMDLPEIDCGQYLMGLTVNGAFNELSFVII
jgi:hypothetical protein